MDSFFSLFAVNSTVAAVLFTFCNWIGVQMDLASDDDYREKFGEALRTGAWVKLLHLFYSYVGGILDYWLGPRLLSLRMLLWSTLLSSSGIVTYMILLNNMRVPLWNVVLFFVTRGSPAIVIDYLTLVRVRHFCRRIKTQPILPQIILSIIFDLISLWVTLLAYLIMIQIINPGTGEVTYITWVDIRDTLIISPQLIAGSPGEALRVASPALVPALLFYLYTVSTLILKSISILALPVTAVSRHMRFPKPFTVAGRIAGFTLVFATISGEWLWRHI